MSRDLRYLDTAMDDFADIATYLAQESGARETGDNFIIQLLYRCERLAALPGTIGTARSELEFEFRSTPYQNYIIYFRYTAHAVEVISVLHASRDAEAHFHG